MRLDEEPSQERVPVTIKTCHNKQNTKHQLTMYHLYLVKLVEIHTPNTDKPDHQPNK